MTSFLPEQLKDVPDDEFGSGETQERTSAPCLAFFSCKLLSHTCALLVFPTAISTDPLTLTPFSFWLFYVGLGCGCFPSPHTPPHIYTCCVAFSEKHREFMQHRKEHYNMKEAMRRARELMAREEEEEEDDDNDDDNNEDGDGQANDSGNTEANHA